MFKWLFYYWLNPTDTPAIESKINLWAFINIRIFKIKVTNQIVYYILNLNNLYIKKLNIFYKNIAFELFFIKLLNYFTIFTIIFIILIILS